MVVTKIVAGTARGRKIKVPPEGTRPTSAKVREAIFSKLDHWGAVRGAKVLDLFAGSGALGIEAVSRGASSADFVDRSRVATQIVRQNLTHLKMNSKGTVTTRGALSFLMHHSGPWDLVFIDPPYSWPDADLTEVLETLAGKLSPDALVVIERDARSSPLVVPEPLEVEERKDWGETAAWFVGLPAQSA